MASPVPHLLVMTVVLVLQGAIFGAQLAEESFPEFEQPDSGGGFFGGALDILGAIISAIWGVVTFVFNLVTFNVPGAPWFIRVPVATYFGGTIVWTIASLVRGGS